LQFQNLINLFYLFYLFIATNLKKNVQAPQVAKTEADFRLIEQIPHAKEV